MQNNTNMLKHNRYYHYLTPLMQAKEAQIPGTSSKITLRKKEGWGNCTMPKSPWRQHSQRLQPAANQQMTYVKYCAYVRDTKLAHTEQYFCIHMRCGRCRCEIQHLNPGLSHVESSRQGWIWGGATSAGITKGFCVHGIRRLKKGWELLTLWTIKEV